MGFAKADASALVKVEVVAAFVDDHLMVVPAQDDEVVLVRTAAF